MKDTKEPYDSWQELITHEFKEARKDLNFAEFLMLIFIILYTAYFIIKLIAITIKHLI